MTASASLSAPQSTKPISLREGEMGRAVAFATRRADDYVVQFDYVDAKGQTTRRTVSPIRFVSGDRFLALCLCREEPRQFYLQRCSNPQLIAAADVLMPIAMN